MEKRIITVSREFGSGGRSVGKALAKRLGWKYYDKELVKAVAEKTGFDPRFIEERGRGQEPAVLCSGGTGDARGDERHVRL